MEIRQWDDEEALFTLLENYLVATEREKGNLIANAAELPERYRINRSQPHAALGGKVAFVAAQSSQLFGCVLVGVNDATAEISRLWVEPEHRATGAGRALMQAAITHAEASGASSVELTVWQWRTGARRLYESLGFSEAQSWDERPDLVCMRRA